MQSISTNISLSIYFYKTKPGNVGVAGAYNLQAEKVAFEVATIMKLD